jgi:RNA polymerase sigma-70 factor, ECF subfamily
MDWAAFTDEELIGAWRAGAGDESLGELFRRCRPRITSWCVRFTGDRELAHDLAQDVLFRAYRSMHTYRGDSRFSTWLYVIARNQCTSALQKRAGQPAHVDAELAENLPDTGWFEIHEKVELDQLRARKWRMVMDALTRMEARVMMLHYGEEVPLGDITRHLGLTNKSGAKAYIVSARRKLSSMVEAQAKDRAVPMRRPRANRSVERIPNQTATFVRQDGSADSPVPFRIAV